MKEAEEREFEEFIGLLKSAKKAPSHAKPPKSSWLADGKVRDEISSLEAFAIDAWASTDQRKLAGMVSQTRFFFGSISSEFYCLLTQTAKAKLCNQMYFCGCVITGLKIHGVAENGCLCTKPSHRYWIFSCTCQS